MGDVDVYAKAPSAPPPLRLCGHGGCRCICEGAFGAAPTEALRPWGCIGEGAFGAAPTEALRPWGCIGEGAFGAAAYNPGYVNQARGSVTTPALPSRGRRRRTAAWGRRRRSLRRAIGGRGPIRRRARRLRGARPRPRPPGPILYLIR